MAMSENSKKVYEYVKEMTLKGQLVTANDIAEALDLKPTTVNGCVTSAFQKKGDMERVEGEIEVVDSEGNVKHKAVKFIRVTEKGMNLDVDAE